MPQNCTPLVLYTKLPQQNRVFVCHTQVKIQVTSERRLCTHQRYGIYISLSSQHPESPYSHYSMYDGKHFEYRAATFNMTDEEKDNFCSVLKNLKLPYGSASNISRCVNLKERKLSGYKSHDAHIILQYLLQIAVLKSLKPEVAIPLIKLGAIYRGICKKTIDLGEIKKLQQEIIQILCQFEITIPPSFFDIMVHLQIHLCKEVEPCSPVYSRWMYPIEQYLGKLKSYVRNRSRLEASIAEGYVAEECLNFFSRFFGANTTVNSSYVFESPERLNEGYALGTRRNKDGTQLQLDDDTFIKAHRYILFNCDNKEIESLIEEHRILVEIQVKLKKYKKERSHTVKFQKWLKEKVQQKESTSRELAALAEGPNRVALGYSGYAINGYRFYTKYRDAKCTTQNSGVFYSALTTSFSSSKDDNPIVGTVDYYGAIEEIIELQYWGVYDTVLFKCCWYQQVKDLYGLPRVNFNKLCQQNDPFVMAGQVQQVFYVADPVEKGVHYVVKKLEMECSKPEFEKDLEQNVLDGDKTDWSLQYEVDNVSWSREDIPRRKVLIPTKV